MNEIHYSHESSVDLAEIEKYIIEVLYSPKAAKKYDFKNNKKDTLLREIC